MKTNFTLQNTHPVRLSYAYFILSKRLIINPWQFWRMAS